jgi:hypothetical protein
LGRGRPEARDSDEEKLYSATAMVVLGVHALVEARRKRWRERAAREMASSHTRSTLGMEGAAGSTARRGLRALL